MRDPVLLLVFCCEMCYTKKKAGEGTSVRFVVAERDHGKLLRTYLRELGVSAALAARLKRLDDGILLNGRRVTVRAVLSEGDVLELAIEEREPLSHVVPRSIPVEILLETEDLLVVSKAANMPTHPSHGHFEDTLANGLAYHYQVDGLPFRPRFINRLDRNTTGIVLVARHALSASTLSAAMARGEIQKTYLALVQGRMKENTVIETGIRRQAESVIFREVCALSEGDYAKTVVEVLAAGDAFSLVRLLPATGRTHQLRVHMASVGHPLLGDELYGDGTGLRRHALHAAMLCFPHPRSGERITVRAALPQDMALKIQELGEEALRLAKQECGQTGAEL